MLNALIIVFFFFYFQAQGILNKLMTAESKQELTELFNALNACLAELDVATQCRLVDLKDPAEQDDLQAARAWLKVNSIIMCTASTV